MAPSKNTRSSLLDEDISYELESLFDPYNLYDMPSGRRLDGFHKRDLAHVRHYKAAVNIFGGPLSRKRAIIAPPMDTPLKRYLGVNNNKLILPAPSLLNSSPNQPSSPRNKPLDESEIENIKTLDYKSWIEKRKKMRNNLDNMKLSEEYLRKKVDKSDLEKRVLGKLNDVSTENQEKAKRKPKHEVQPKSKKLPLVPKIESPAPTALQKMDEHLKVNNMRLIDLFKMIDKDCNGKATKKEFKEAIAKVRLNISDKEVEDMIVCLDDDINDELDYSELAHGLRVWQKERRENRKKSTSSSQSSYMSQEVGSAGQESKSSRPTSSRQSSAMNRPRTSSPQNSEFILVDKLGGAGDGEEVRSYSRTSQSSSPQFLDVPVIDTSVEKMILSSDEAQMDLIKHDKEVIQRNKYRKKHGISADEEKAPGVIKIGNKAVDDHCSLSTLGGDAAPLVDRFRQKKFEEFENCIKLCKDRGVIFSQRLMEKVLLHPGDRPYNDMSKEASSSSNQHLLTSKFADPPAPIKPPIEVLHKDKIKRSKSGQLMMDSRHVYRKSKQVSSNVTKENLSTGKALIRNKVDTWMTFEEYERLTSKHTIRYKHLSKKSDDSVFWPGQLLDKLALCMPPYDHNFEPNHENSIFRQVKSTKKSNPGYDNDISYWPVGPKGHIQVGTVDRFYRRS